MEEQLSNEIDLTVCITVYNQAELVKEFLDEISICTKNNVEFLISDDCSTENIKKLVNSYNNKLIRYIKTEYNRGHDWNIVNGIKQAQGNYVYVFRSRDKLKINVLDELISYVKMTQAGYYAFSSVNQIGKTVFSYSDLVYPKGKRAINAHNKLFVHPSGNLYDKRLIDFSSIEQMLNNYFAHDKFSFVVHDMLRIQLATKASIATSRLIAWQYTDTNACNDIAVNSRKDKKSVYDPEIEYKRYRCLYKYIEDYYSEYEKFFIYKLIKRFFRSIIIDFPKHNKDKNAQKHYAFEQTNYDLLKEIRCFFSVTRELAINNKLFVTLYLCKLVVEIPFFDIKHEIVCRFGNSSMFNRVYKVIKRN